MRMANIYVNKTLAGVLKELPGNQYVFIYEEDYDGVKARVIQHEYDHIEGKLFIDHLKPLKRTLLKGKLENISKGKVNVDYKMRFPKK